jgi:methyl-accepting chemotaxis protein
MQGRPSGSQIWLRLFARVVAHDVASVPAVVLIWTGFFGLADWRVHLSLLLCVVVVTHVRLRAWVTPYARWDAHSDGCADAELLELDAMLQRGGRTHAFRYAAGSVVAALGATMLGMLGVGALPTFGDAELMVGVFLLLAMVFGQLALLGGLLEPALLDARAAVNEQVHARGLETARQQTSFVRASVSYNVLFVLALFFALVATGGMATSDGWRDADQLRAQLRAELGAQRLAAGDSLDGDLTIISASELPTLLGTPTGETLLGIDRRHAVALAAAPLTDGRFVLAQAPTDERLWQILAFVAVFPPLFLIMFIAGNLSIAGAITRPLEQLRHSTALALSAGDLRGIKRYRTPNNDEIGHFVRDFNGMLDVLGELASGAREVATGNLAVSFDRPGDLHEAFRGMLGQLREVVMRIRSTALELASAAAEIHAISIEQERVMETQSRSIGEVGATVDQLATASEDIARTSMQVLGNAEQSLSNADTVVSRIDELNTQVGSITQLLAVIREIADRSDLLALNGALEATRAGDVGRGFALVAAEMRRLAERTAGSVADASVRVTDIGSTGTKTVLASAQSRELAERTAAAARQISSVTTRQHEDTQRVSTAVREVINGVAATAVSTSQARAAAEGLRQQADELERLTRHFRIDAVG